MYQFTKEEIAAAKSLQINKDSFNIPGTADYVMLFSKDPEYNNIRRILEQTYTRNRIYTY